MSASDMVCISPMHFDVELVSLYHYLLSFVLNYVSGGRAEGKKNENSHSTGLEKLVYL